MNTTRVRIYPSLAVERIEAIHRTDGVPFRAYETLVNRIKAAITDEQEEATCVIVHTADGPEAWYDHVLSPMERLQGDMAEMSFKLAQAERLLPRAGEAMTAEQVAALRVALGK